MAKRNPKSPKQPRNKKKAVVEPIATAESQPVDETVAVADEAMADPVFEPAAETLPADESATTTEWAASPQIEIIPDDEAENEPSQSDERQWGEIPLEETAAEPARESNISEDYPADNRTAKRIDSELKTIVQGQTRNEKWKEVTKVTTVSKNGAGFLITRPCQVGTLLALVMPMPVALRSYDLDQNLYPVMGLVQYCHKLIVDDETLYRVGVAFVGKEIPESYHANPLQNYHISGALPNGLWKISESDKPFLPRMATRFWVPIDVTVSLMQKYQREIYKESTITENISATGACIPSSLEIAIGDRVKFASREHNFYAIAVVRNLRKREDDLSKVHLEFVDEKFPVAKILP